MPPLKKQVRALLELMRLPNLFTAAADVLAGFLIVNGLDFNPLSLLALCLASSAFYAAGCVMNDIVDLNQDTLYRPNRPLPSKRMTVRTAELICIILFCLGLFGAFPAGFSSLIAAAFLVASILSYNVYFKNHQFLGPLNMGACRALNLIMGMSAGLTVSHMVLMLPVITMTYTCLISVLGNMEVGKERNKPVGVIAGWVGLMLITFMLQLHNPLPRDGILFLVILILLTGYALLPMLFQTRRNGPARAVKIMVMSIPLLDAVYASGIHGWLFGLPVAACFFPAWLFSRSFHVT